MASVKDSGLGHGTNGSPQGSIEEFFYQQKVKENEISAEKITKPVYKPSPKHEPGHNWGSKNPINTSTEGQHLLETGYKSGKQIYNVTSDGKLVKFQPDNSPDNGYHAYEVFSPPDVPPSVLKQMVNDGKISRIDYKKFLKGKK